MPPRIDAHAHFFYPGYVDTLPENCRRQSPDEITLYEALARSHEIEQVLAVGYEGDAWASGNNEYLATLATHHDWVKPVAFVADPSSLQVNQLSAWKTLRFVGISLYLMTPESASTLNNVPDEVWRWLSDQAWIISVNSTGELWSGWTTVLAQHPELRLLISHLGLPSAVAEAPSRDEAATGLRAVIELAAYPHIYVKFSGFYALARPCYAYPHQPSWPYAEILCEHFGTGRVVWASDFSPALEFVSFPQTIGVVAAMPWLTDNDLAAIFHDNIARLLAEVQERNRVP